jgi:AraC-like DNA-binding protein
MAIEDLRFTVVELCALLGLIQCVYILVYMALRAGQWSQAALPFAYFLLLGLAFLGDFAFHYIGVLPLYKPLLWSAWLASLPLSVLVIKQISNRTQLPEKRDFLLLIIVPLFICLAFITAQQHKSCAITWVCAPLVQWMIIYGIMGGSLALLTLWLWPESLIRVRDDTDYGRERYWLVLAILAANSAFLLLALGALSSNMVFTKVMLARDLIGLALVYLAGTILFRIYPCAIRLTGHSRDTDSLTGEDYAIARHIEKLLTYDKVYHEPSYGRVDLARELNIAETRLSRIVNLYFGKSLPQLLNSYRIADAKYFLCNTDASIGTIAEEAGFNSLASFNRVFRENTGQSPREYRYNHDDEQSHKPW